MMAWLALSAFRLNHTVAVNFFVNAFFRILASSHLLMMGSRLQRFENVRKSAEDFEHLQISVNAMCRHSSRTHKSSLISWVYQLYGFGASLTRYSIERCFDDDGGLDSTKFCALRQALSCHCCCRGSWPQCNHRPLPQLCNRQFTIIYLP